MKSLRALVRRSLALSVALTWLCCSTAFAASDAPAEPAVTAAPANPPEAAAGREKLPNPSAELVALPKIPARVSELLEQRNYAEAIKAIDAALVAHDAAADYLSYLKGRALYAAGQYDAANAEFDRFAKDYPKSTWARRARFGKAVALARKGEFHDAEVIYRAEVSFLLSATRKQEIADIYLKFADAYFQPKDEQIHPPEYKKALEFYQKALEDQPAGARRVEVELRVARCFQLLNQLPEAAARYAQFIKDNPEVAEAIEARFRLGEVQLAQGQPQEARRTWQDLLAAHPDSKSERIPEAAFKISLTYGLPQPASDEDLSLGVASLEAFLKDYPGNKLAAQAYLRIAESYMARGRYDDAVRSLKGLLLDPRYADREELADARNLLGRSYQLQRNFPAALVAWRDYLTRHPTHHAWSAVQRQIVDTEFLMAADAADAKKFDEARKLWTEFLAKYPLDPRGPRILYLFGEMDFRQGKFQAAIDDWRRLVSKYPSTEDASRGQFMIALVLESKLHQLDEALKDYRHVQTGSYVGQAQAAIARLTVPSLSIATDRVFRTDESPKIHLQTRNIEAVTVRAYRVDLEAYFRKMHIIQGVEGLDVALIDPDRTFEFKVPEYAEYQHLESQIEVRIADVLKPAAAVLDPPAAKDNKPLDLADKKLGPDNPVAMALAVTVSSKTLEATTLLVQSDLDLIVKSSRDEIFVFAENMRTGEPWPGVRLLISNGQQVFAEAMTGLDGVFKQSYKELKDAADVRVLGLAPGGVASNIVSLQGVGVAQGLADKGYLYTDRSTYRPGQLVFVRGVLRRAVDDNYTVERGKKFTLEVLDPRGRSFWQEDVKLSEFGSFHSQVMLPETSPVGNYRVRVFDKEGHSHEGAFEVRQYQLEPIHLSVETDRRVYYRGETIEGRIKAAFYYGAPLAGREVRYQLADGAAVTAKTDDKGEIHFKFPTREFRESQTLRLVVQLPERNLQAEQNFYLATQGFAFSLSTTRPVFVAGESFELTVKARDAEGKPLAQKFTLHVLQRTRVDGKLGERAVEQHELTADAKDGIARQTLHLDAGGEYLLRAEGIDRFKNPVTAMYVVKISDDKDPVRLRILADKHTYKAGDTADLQIYWREKPALALITFQGARVLDYRLVRLKAGANKLSIPMAVRLAPNFDLCVAVMTDARSQKVEEAAELNDVGSLKRLQEQMTVDDLLAGHPQPRRFHQASSPFSIERPLQITLLPKRKAGAKGPMRPGEEIELAISAVDPQGKPVVAELSLGMVEQALWNLFGSNVAPIDDVFRGSVRQSALRTTTTAAFAYYPVTRPIDRSLLNEEDRLKVAAEEAGSKAELGRLSLVVSQTQEVHEQIAQAQASESEGVRSPGTRLQRYSISKPSYFGGENGVAQEEGDESLAAAETQTKALTAGVGVNSDKGLPMGNAAGGKEADFDSLVDTITSTIDPQDPQEKARHLRRNLEYAGRGVNPKLPQSAAGFNAPHSGKGSGEVTTESWDDGRDAKGWSYGITRGTTVTGWAEAADQFKQQLADPAGNLVVLADGKQSNLNFAAELGDKPDEGKVAALAGKLAKSGGVLLAVRGPLETGYWNPTIVTDEHGQASVTITLPEQSTAWQLAAKGITVDTLCGEATSELTASKALFGELKLPPAFVDGDDAQIQVTVHDTATDAKDPVTVTLKTTIGSKTVEESKTVPAAAGAIAEISFAAAIHRAAPEQPKPGDVKAGDAKTGAGKDSEASFELTITSAGRSDVVRRVVPIHPYGLPVYASAGGSATADTTVWVEAPKEMPLAGPSLQILIGPTVEQSLLDALLAPPPACQFESLRVASGLDSTTSDLLAALALQKLIGKTREAGGPQAAALDARVRSGISSLVSAQHDDGGWSWTGAGGASHRLTSARVLWALATAKRAGYQVSDAGYEKAVTWLQSQIAVTSDADFESKAVLLHALAVADHGDFTLANRLYRNRPALSSAALAQLALALAEMDHKPMAEDLLTLLAKRNFADAIDREAGIEVRQNVVALEASVATDSLPWSDAAAELRSLYALALEAVAPDSPKIKEQIDWLLAHRTGYRWAPDKATGPAVAALAQWFGKNRFDEEHFKLTVFVNDLQAAVLDVDPKAGTQIVDVPWRMLKAGKQRLNFQLTGRGRYTFQAILSGFVAADKLTSTTKAWSVRRYYEPAPLELDGHEIPRGFDVLQGSYTTFRNPLTQLPVGRRGHVELEVWRQTMAGGTPEERLPYLIVTEPIPSGATVIESSIAGGFERYELGAGEITFYVGNRAYVDPIRFDVHGYLAGQYRTGPTVVRNAYRLDQMAVSERASLAVLPLGQKSEDAYRLTPRELYELGKRLFEKGDYAVAGLHLTELLAKWNVEPNAYKESARMLLDIHLRTGPPAEIVRYFEIIKEKWPELELPFEKIVKVAAAYHELGEYERSYLVFRATTESSFGRESAVAGFLEGQGEFLRSVAVMNRLLAEYPPEPYIAAATFALSQRVYAKAPQAASDPKLREKKINRVDLIAQALAMVDHFLIEYPDDPAADQAAFSACNALLELKAYRGVIARATKSAALYPNSDYLDSFWYIVAYGHFALGEHEQALAMARKVAEAHRIDKKTGADVESPNKWEAIYIMGQVYHSLGQAAKAIAEYTRVEDRFADAKQAIAYFMRKEISVPEVTVIRPGKPAELEMKFRNLATADVKVYRIDLMKFSLLKRNLAGITQINLAGIRPLHEVTLDLGDGKDYRDRTQKLTLPLKDEGAYLLVCRGGDLYASGLVLVSPLAVEVQEDAPSSEIRVTVKNVVKDRYVADVQAKVIGSRNAEFISGETDLRGVFVAQGVRGTSTVIAQADSGRYAFFRGQTDLGPPEPAKPGEAPINDPFGAAPSKDSKSQAASSPPDNNNNNELLNKVFQGNSDIQGQQDVQLKNIYHQPKSGVKVKDAY